MKYLTLKRIVATAVLGTAFSFAASAAPSNPPVGPQFRVGTLATATQAVEHTGHRIANTASSSEHPYPRFRVPYPNQPRSHVIEARSFDLDKAYVYNEPRQLGERTWLR